MLGLVDPDKHVPDAPLIREIAREWLKDPVLDLRAHASGAEVRRARWLLIFDNADDPELLRQFWHTFKSGSVLVTSRDPNVRDVLSTDQLNIDLQPFSEEEGVLALKQLADLRAGDLQVQQREDMMARQICKKLGGWPLGISQMAGIIRHEYMSLTEFYERYEDSEERRDFQDRPERDMRGTSRGTMASMIISDFISAQARVLLEVCSMLYPDCIQERLFMEPCEEMLLLQDFPRERSAYYRARAELVQLSLIRLNDKREIWMHRFVQDTVVSKMDKCRFEAVFKGAVSLVSTAWGESSLDEKSHVQLWGKCANLFPHVLQLQSLYREGSKDHRVQPFYRFAWLLTESAWWQLEIGNTHVLTSMLTLAQSICDLLPLSEKLDLLSDIYHMLGGWANETNHARECLEYNSIYLQLRLEAVARGEAATPQTAAAYNQKGTGWMMVKDYESAKRDFRKSQEVYRGLPAYTPTMASLPIVNLAVAEWLTGNLTGATKLLHEGLTDRERKFGVDDSESFITGRFLHALGNVRYDQAMLQPEGDDRERLLEESDNFHRRALTQYQSTIGTHHRTADVCHRVAEHCLRKGDTDSARLLVSQALKTWNVDAVSFQPEIARTTFLEAKCARCAGYEVEAKRLRMRAASIRATLLPEDETKVEDLHSNDFNELVAFWSR